MKRPTRCFATLAVLALLARAAVGCATTYDGSEKFYEQHPEYTVQPGYMHPADPDDNADDHPARPW